MVGARRVQDRRPGAYTRTDGGYLDLARATGIDAVLSISNHYTTSSSEYPIPIDRKKLRKVSIRHWSWVHVLTEAEVQKQYRGVKDPDQAYILDELIRYLSDPRSGVVQFDDMGTSWTNVREGARVRTLRRTDPDVAAVANRWDELIRFLSLDLTKELGRDVRQLARRQEAAAVDRAQALRRSLAETGRLYADVQIPDTAGPSKSSLTCPPARSSSQPNSRPRRRASRVAGFPGCSASCRRRRPTLPSMSFSRGRPRP